MVNFEQTSTTPKTQFSTHIVAHTYCTRHTLRYTFGTMFEAHNNTSHTRLFSLDRSSIDEEKPTDRTTPKNALNTTESGVRERVERKRLVQKTRSLLFHPRSFRQY